MKNLLTFNEFINENYLNETKKDVYYKQFKKEVKIDPILGELMPYTYKNIDQATRHFAYCHELKDYIHISKFNVESTEYIVKNKSIHTDKTFKIKEKAFWQIDLGTEFIGRVEEVNISYIELYDITNPKKEKSLGRTYVFTSDFQDELVEKFEKIK